MIDLNGQMARALSRLMILCSLIYLQQTIGSACADTSGCICPGDILTYECTVMGVAEGSTVWTGNVVKCSNNGIVLLHHRFTNGTNGTCNNGAIVGRSISVEGNNYISQLTVTVTSKTMGKTVECDYDDGNTFNILFSWVTPTIGQPSPPNKLNASSVDLSLRELSFSWSPVAPDCPAIHYNILASNCGSCPTTTNHTTVTCTDFLTKGSQCTFAIQTVICGNITGNVSDPVSITFYATDVITASTDILHPTENLSTYNSTVDLHNLDTNTAVYSISIGSLATALIISTVVFTTTIIFILRSKAKIKAALQLSNRAGETTHDIHDHEPMYEDITGQLSSVSVINTQDNGAYGLARTIPPT